MTTAGTQTEFAGQLKQWRLRCRVGQLDPPIRAATTQRYLSYLEQFARAVDVTLAELHLEAFLLADEVTARILRERADM